MVIHITCFFTISIVASQPEYPTRWKIRGRYELSTPLKAKRRYGKELISQYYQCGVGVKEEVLIRSYTYMSSLESYA